MDPAVILRLIYELFNAQLELTAERDRLRREVEELKAAQKQDSL